MAISPDTRSRLVNALDSIRAGNEVADGINFALALAQARGSGMGDIRSDGSIPFASNQSMGGNRLVGLANPLDSTDAANKYYVDAQLNTLAHVNLDNLLATSVNQDLVPDGDLLRSLGTASKSWLFAHIDEAYVTDIILGGLMDLGDIGRIINVPDPIDPGDVASKHYVDSHTSVGGGYFVDTFTLNSTQISNKSVTLSGVPTILGDTILNIIGGITQSFGADFTVSGNQLSWSGLGLDGILAIGDKLIIQFH